MRKVENEIKKHINNRLIAMKDYIEYQHDKYLNETFEIENIDEIEMFDFNLSELNYPHTEKLYNVVFKVKHKDIIYTFETSNCYFYKGEFKWVEDIYENINNLLNNFRFLLENYEYFIEKSDEGYEDDDDESIEDIAYDLGFEIDDDGHWNPIETYYFDEYETFKDCLTLSDGQYTFHFSEDNGKFYWEW